MFDTEITYQTHYKKPVEIITLSDWLRWCKQGHPNKAVTKQLNEYRDLIAEQMNKGLSEDEAKQVLKDQGKYHLKTNLPLVAPGAVCDQRRKEGYIKHNTGWVALDIDLKDNPHIANIRDLRDQLMNNVYIAFAGLSAGGNGVWCLVRVKDPQKHAEYYKQLGKDFAGRGIVLDSTKGENPHDARFYSYDPECKVKQAKIYDRLPKPVPVKPVQKLPRQRSYSQHTGDVFQDAMNFAKERGHTFEPGTQHTSILVLSGYLNWKGVPENEAERWIKANITPEINSNCISYPYNNGKANFGAGRRHIPLPKKDKPVKRKFVAPHGWNPYTGEIFDARGYPADWDDIDLTQTAT